MKGFFAVLGLLVLLSACTTDKKQGEIVPVYTVSIAPLAYLLHGLLGDSVEVEVLVPRGVSPETFDPAPSALRRLNGSAAYVQIGNLGFERVWTKRIQSMYPKLPIWQTDTAPTEGKKSEATRLHDPHVWMSPRRMGAMADSLARFLDVDAHALHARIAQVDDSIAALLAGCRGAAFLVYHPVLTYFAEDYGLQQLAIEQDGKEPTMRQLRRVASDFLPHGHKQIKAMFVQAEFDNRTARMVAEELGIAVEVIDPLTEDWEQETLRIAHLIRTYYE
jgi:zinc transport system substrate-binding protein